MLFAGTLESRPDLGKFVLIDHGPYLSPRTVLYSLNSELRVKRFDHVSPNQTIALSGSGSDGLARLHFEIIGLTKPGDILKLLPNKGHFRFELSPVEKIRLVQIILAGYDEKKKIEPTGVLDSPTIKAIRAYEKEMGMPLGGTVSDQLIKSLVSISGLDRAYEFDLTPARTSKHE